MGVRARTVAVRLPAVSRSPISPNVSPTARAGHGGERTIRTTLSVDRTCRLQRRSLYSYLADVLNARARGDPVPSLA